MPGRADGFYPAWRGLAAGDRTVGRAGRRELRRVAERADDAVLDALYWLEDDGTVHAMQGPEAAGTVPRSSAAASDDIAAFAGVLRGSGVFASRTRPAAAAPVGSAARRWSPDTVFERPALQAALAALVAPDGPLQGCGLLRGKGVFRTERAWYGWQWVDGRVDWQESAWRADNRVELLANGSIDPQAVDIALQPAVSKG
jgi:hypothetical protein